MGQPYIGEIRMFAGNFAPAGWAFCDGRQLAISENDALFNLIGTTYGGDGQQTFNLPDLRGRMPVHAGTLGGNTYILAQTGGAETVSLSANQMPSHAHPVACSSVNGNSADPSGKVPAASATKLYTAGTGANASLNGLSLSSAGGNQPHENMPPFLAVNFIIALFGVFPSQN
jgi:microcystin-dependent protein